MERASVPYKVEIQVATFEGDWTADQIDNGEAGPPKLERQVDWYEPTADGPRKITDESRIEELEAGL